MTARAQQPVPAIPVVAPPGAFFAFSYTGSRPGAMAQVGTPAAHVRSPGVSCAQALRDPRRCLRVMLCTNEHHQKELSHVALTCPGRLAGGLADRAGAGPRLRTALSSAALSAHGHLPP
jgi:hypothetical protein